MSLVDYKDKRDFTATDEPDENKNMAEDITPGSIYVIQEHDSKKLHYDLRLQFGGVLRSWAVPKEPPTEAGVKRLAIPTRTTPWRMQRSRVRFLRGTTVPVL